MGDSSIVLQSFSSNVSMSIEMSKVSVNYKNIGMWLSDKKSQKLNWNELINAFNSRGYHLIKVNV